MRILRVFILLLFVVSLTSLALADATLEVGKIWTTDYATPEAVAPYGYFDPHQPNYDFWMSSPTNHNGHLDAKYEVSQSWEGPGKVNSTRTFSGLPASFTLAQGHSSATATGYADAHNLQLGAYGSTASAGPYAESTVDAFFENKFTLLPSENSSLQYGDQVLLSWNFSFVGHMDLGGTTFPTSTGAYVGFDAWGKIQGTTKVCGGVGEAYHCGYPTLAEWWSNADAELYDVNSNYWPDRGESSVDRDWGAKTNHGVNYRDGQSVDNLYNKDAWGENSEMAALWSANFDHGDVPGGMIFEATVGDTYTISSDLWMRTWTDGQGSANGNFFDTLSNNFVPVTSGVTLNWQHQPDAPVSGVPEPTTLLMLGCGLGFLGVLRRR